MFQIYRLQDIQLDDTELKAEYYNKFFVGDITGAKKIVANNPQLSSKVLNASNLNNLLNAILSLETEYHNETTNVMVEDTNKFQVSIDELIYTTTYKNDIQYEINNVVDYNGNIYFCKKQPPIATLPSNDEYWLDLGLKGEQGYPSTSVNYVGGWTTNKQYKKYDMVVYKSDLYIAKKDNTNVTPNNNGIEWTYACAIGRQGIYVSYDDPQLQQGQIWIELLR